MKFLERIEIIGGAFRFGNFLYLNTKWNSFYWGQSTANKLFWRFYWLTPNTKIKERNEA